MKRLLPLVVLLTSCIPGSGPKTTVTIPQGASTAAIAESLKVHGLVSDARTFRVLARVLGFDTKLRSGRFELPQGSNEFYVLWQLSRPGNTTARITFPEGFRLTQVADALEEHGICTAAEFLAASRNKHLLDSLGIPGPSAEGFLFPDTYEFELDSDPAAIISRMSRRFFSVYAELTDANEPQRHRDSAQSKIQNPKSKILDVVILASIVEREAVVPSEAPLIAGVFKNRLKKHMPLQSCATVEYILPSHKLKLTNEDTRIESPYNTYLHTGLPPGAISNPGRNALAAALSPAATDYLFFVAKGDGSHVFSRTWSEHQAARRRIARANS